jgi:hypothetical protein
MIGSHHLDRCLVDDSVFTGWVLLLLNGELSEGFKDSQYPILSIVSLAFLLYQLEFMFFLIIFVDLENSSFAFLYYLSKLLHFQ